MSHNVTPPQRSLAGELPLLHRACEGYKIWQELLQQFPRISRYTLGAKIDDIFTEVIELILAASYTSKQYKGSIVRKASSKFDALKLFLRIAWELGYLDHKQYARISQPLDDTGKMLGGWLKQIQSIPDSTVS